MSQEWNGFVLTKETNDIISQIREGQFEDFAFGCILGSFIGDAGGSLVEFIETRVDENLLKKCLEMPGGGTHGNGPGQVTDDGEMTMCLLWGLSKNQKEQGLLKIDLNHVCEYYKEWILSSPFDIGVTTKDALGPLVLPEN